MVLERLQLRIFRPAIVEDLDLDAGVGGVALERRADADAVVGVRGQAHVEAEDEVGVFLLGVTIAAVLLGGEQDAFLHLVALAAAVLDAAVAAAVDPPGEVLAVDE